MATSFGWFRRSALMLLIGLVMGSCSTPEPTLREQPGERAALKDEAAEFQVWPKRISSEDLEITIHTPVPESWSGERVRQRAAVAVESAGAARPLYGEVLIEARTLLDEAERSVRFSGVRIVRLKLPRDPELEKAALSALRKNREKLLEPMNADQLTSAVDVSRVESKRKVPGLADRTPEIIFSREPAVLALIDGEPVLREAGEVGLLRVMNSRNLILKDSSGGKYYLAVGSRWVEAASLDGPWNSIEDAPGSVERIRNEAVRQGEQVDLLGAPQFGPAPQVYVRSRPAVLIQSQGAPGFKPIVGTQLLYVDNTQDALFLDQSDQNFYTLVSGRWYRSASLDGPWKAVAARELSADFSKIPEGHRKGAVRSSVAGTPEAREAALRNEVPQVARVDRRNMNLELKYDGAPRFEPIPETSLRYAVNCALPVIEVDSQTYYALRAGIWFVSRSPQGPWSVASEVPAVIYSIPPSSPLYYITYVRVYDAGPSHVHVGYTAGYLGSYHSSDGVVVFGTGYFYPPWIGTVWIGHPTTFGVGWGYWGAFSWWGPWWGWGPVVYPYAYYGPYPYPAHVPPPANPINVYQGWSAQSVSAASPSLFNTAYYGGPQSSTVTLPGLPAWQTGTPGALPADTPLWGTGTTSESGRADAFSGGETPYSTTPETDPGGWSTSQEASPPPPAAAPAPPPPPPAAPPAAGQAFPGEGWGPK